MEVRTDSRISNNEAYESKRGTLEELVEDYLTLDPIERQQIHGVVVGLMLARRGNFRNSNNDADSKKKDTSARKARAKSPEARSDAGSEDKGATSRNARAKTREARKDVGSEGESASTRKMRAKTRKARKNEGSTDETRGYLQGLPINF